MVIRNTRRGFTLIELLVVVLIIGILAAVAVTQYQKAVDKSRTMASINTLKAIKDAQEIYYLAHGQYAEDFTALDVALPGGSLWNTPSIVQYPNGKRYYMFIDAENGTQSIKVNLAPDVQLEWYLQHHTFWKDELPGSTIVCAGENDRGKNVCKSLGGIYFSTHENGVTENYVINGF